MRRRFFVGVFYLSLINFCCSEKKITCCVDSINSHKYQEYNPPTTSVVKDSIINIEYFSHEFKKTGIYLNTGFQFYQRGDSNYIIYLNGDKDSLVFVNLFQSKIKKVPINHLIGKNQKYTLRVINDTLHLLNSETYKYGQILIDSNFNLRLLQILDLKFAFTSKNLFLNTNVVIDKKIVYEKPYLFLTYGNFKTKNNIDSKMIIKIDLETKTSKKIIDYPNKYKRCDMLDFYSTIENVSDSIFALVFHKMDFFAIINKQTEKYARVNDSFFNSQFMCYDRNLAANLAYTSKLYDNDESNDNLIYFNRSFYLIKQLGRENKAISPKIAILVFDNTLQLRLTLYSDHLLARLSFPYKNGIVVINDSLTKAHYYDFSKN